MGPSINYVVLVGEGGSPKDDLLHRHYLIKKTTRGEGVKNRQDNIVYGRPLKGTKNFLRPTKVKFHFQS